MGNLARAILLLPALLLPPSHVSADGVFRRTGRLAVFSPYSSHIAVDLRESGMGRFVVGKIGNETILLRGDRPAAPEDFTPGQPVQVTWRESGAGNEIKTLRAAPEPLPPPAENLPPAARPGDIGRVVGRDRLHMVREKETLLDIARRYDLGFNEIVAVYPDFDPWLPPTGEVLTIPGRRLLPAAPRDGIVINIPEMRLFAYRADKGRQTVRSFPIGIGDTDFPTPTGTFSIGEKSRHPTWYIPPSLRDKYQRASFPPGPDNPLGEYWLGLSDSGYGIHGTDIPWSVGRLVTHGCIRMYPEDIARLYPTVARGAKVLLVYQPVKVAFVTGRLLVEVHPDIYRQAGNLAVLGLDLIARQGLLQLLDPAKFVLAITRKDGKVTDVTLQETGDRQKTE